MDTYDKSNKELLYEAATKLKKWSKDHNTSGYQHEPMAILSKKIFIQLHVSQPAVEQDVQSLCAECGAEVLGPGGFTLCKDCSLCVHAS